MIDWPREVNAQACGQSTDELIERLAASDLSRISTAYFDTSDLQLQAKALTVRLRIKEGAGELTLKWRADSLPGDVRGAECEVDVYRDRALRACSWNHEVTPSDVRAVFAGRKDIADLLSTEQAALLKRLAPQVSAPWRRFGPVEIERWKLPSGSAGKKWRLERWILPDGETLLHEVSFSEKRPLSVEDLNQVMQRYFDQTSIRRCVSDEPKTSLVLRRLSPGELASR